LDNDEKLRLILEILGGEKVTEAKKGYDLLGELATTTGEKAADAGKKTGDALDTVTNQQNVKLRQLGRIFEDISRGQGDAAIHMAERFASSFGIAGTAVIALGIAYETLKPIVTELWKKFHEGSDSAKEKLSENTKELEAYRDKVEHTTKELDKYNKALEEQGKLHDQQHARKLEADAYAERETPDKRAKDRAEILESMIKPGGGPRAMIGEIEAGLAAAQRKEGIDPDLMRAEANRLSRAAQTMHDYEVAESMRQRAEQTEVERKARAEELFSRARAGEGAAIEQIQGILPEGTTAEIFRLAGPAEQMRQRNAEREADETAAKHKKAEEDRKTQLREDIAATKRNDALVKDLKETHHQARLRAQKKQDEVTETALREVEERPAERALEEAQERHDAETARQQAQAGRKKRDDAQAMRESIHLTEQVAQQDTPPDIAPLVNRQAIQSSAKKALELFHQGFRSGEMAAKEAWDQEVDLMRASLRHGPAVNSYTPQSSGLPY